MQLNNALQILNDWPVLAWFVVVSSILGLLNLVITFAIFLYKHAP